VGRGRVRRRVVDGGFVWVSSAVTHIVLLWRYFAGQNCGGYTGLDIEKELRLSYKGAKTKRERERMEEAEDLQ
jgi:hypothetical protein